MYTSYFCSQSGFDLFYVLAQPCRTAKDWFSDSKSIKILVNKYSSTECAVVMLVRNLTNNKVRAQNDHKLLTCADVRISKI